MAPSKIVDCFIFYNELDLLKYRLHIMNPYVDFFVLVESTHTFSGKEKPLVYNENKELFAEFNDKIIHIIVHDLPYKYPQINYNNRDQWRNETFQRDCIVHGLKQIQFEDEDIIMITDVDEIPNPAIVECVKVGALTIEINTLDMDFYYYNLNYKQSEKWNIFSKILSYKKYRELSISCDQIRNYRCDCLLNAGWHLSYFGDSTYIQKKIHAFSHQEYNSDKYTNKDTLEKHINNFTDLFNRNMNATIVPISENTNLPPHYEIYLKNYIVLE